MLVLKDSLLTSQEEEKKEEKEEKEEEKEEEEVKSGMKRSRSRRRGGGEEEEAEEEEAAPITMISRRALMASTSAKAVASRRVTFACSPFIVWMLCHQTYAQGYVVVYCCRTYYKPERVGGLCIRIQGSGILQR